MNRPTTGKDRSAGSNLRVVCSTLLCAMPIYGRGSRLAKARSAPWLCQRTDFIHARHFFYMRAWNRRIRESARLLRVMCSHAWYRESYGERQNFVFCFARRPHSLATHCFLRLSRVCGRSSKEESLPLFVLFVLFGQAKSTLYLLLLFGQGKVPLTYSYFSYKMTAIYFFDRLKRRRTEPSPLFKI